MRGTSRCNDFLGHLSPQKAVKHDESHHERQGTLILGFRRNSKIVCQFRSRGRKVLINIHPHTKAKIGGTSATTMPSPTAARATGLLNIPVVATAAAPSSEGGSITQSSRGMSRQVSTAMRKIQTAEIISHDQKKPRTVLPIRIFISEDRYLTV